MVRKVNRGVSMVEVLMALAIFMIMMIPLVSALVSGMNTTNSAKDTQYRNEYARNLMESVKEVPITILDDADTSYFEKMGSDGVSITSHTDNTTYHKTNADGTITPCPFTRYEIGGMLYLGTKQTKYSYAIEISSENYAKAEANGEMNTNNLTAGVVEDLDQTKVALISAYLGNYDVPAFDALLTKKMAELRARREKTNTAFNPESDVELFKNDKGRRIINIAVTGGKSTGYDVTCTLRYSDNCSEQSSEAGKTIGQVVGMLDYVPYTKHFDELPNIYLMYNVCVYNGQYADDYITFDLSGMDEETDVNVFVIETASNYSNALQEANASEGADWLKGGSGDLYKKAGSDTNPIKRDGVRVGMSVLDKGLMDKKLEHLHVYHNMGEPLKSDYATEDEYNTALAAWNSHAKSADVIYDQTVADEMKMVFGNLYKGLILENVGSLNQAQQDRGLYQVKIWMQKGTVDVNTLKKGSPVLQGTRGGGEID